MKVALISDTHGNAVALDAVLADLERLEPDDVLCLGDLAANGYDPLGVIRRLQRLGCRSVRGNTDTDLLQLPALVDTARTQGPLTPVQRVADIARWAYSQLDEDAITYLKAATPTIERQLSERLDMLCFHGSPRSETEVLEAATDEEALAEIFDAPTARFLVGGHTHVPLLRNYAGSWLVNPGSVGLPFERYGRAGRVPLLGHAQYAVIHIGGAQHTLEFRNVPLDTAAIRQAALASGMPHAAWWSSFWPE